jgi:carbonic anhydrase
VPGPVGESATDRLVRNARVYAESFDNGDLALAPALKLTVLACMDSRLDLFALLGLKEGDAHMLRNAGGAVTDDAIRSLAVSQRMLGTEEIVLIHHTNCGMHAFDDEAFKREIFEETGVEPQWRTESFPDVDEDVRRSLARIKASPFIPHRDRVRGFVYEVETGILREVV